MKRGRQVAAAADVGVRVGPPQQCRCLLQAGAAGYPAAAARAAAPRERSLLLQPRRAARAAAAAAAAAAATRAAARAQARNGRGDGHRVLGHGLSGLVDVEPADGAAGGHGQTAAVGAPGQSRHRRALGLCGGKRGREEGRGRRAGKRGVVNTSPS